MHTFELTIQRQYGELWPVIAQEHLGDRGMPIRVEGALALDQHTLLTLDHDATAYGEALGQALFHGPVRDAFVEALARSEERLRVLLFIEDQTMRGLRWERLRAPVDGEWRLLATYQRAPLSRYLPSMTDRRFPQMGRRDLRALIVAASPGDLTRFGLSHFDVAQAVELARRALGDIPSTILADLSDAAGPPTLDAICAQLTAEPFTLMHIVAHGRVLQGGETVIYLASSEDPTSVDPVMAGRLIERLGALQGARGLPHFTFLATCESASPDADAALGGLGQRLVVELGMPAVVAMAERVSVETAFALSAELYRRLREHGEPDRALVEATAGLAERGDVTVPALFSRLGGRPLFTESANRPLTTEEILGGLTRLEALLPERAPGLAPELTTAVTDLRLALVARPESLSPRARAARAEALGQIDAICAEAADLSFSALALGESPPPYDARCPFPGLQAFKSDAKDFFFGREALVQRLWARLEEYPLLVVLGPSGSGKSSVVHAGLVPALQARRPELPCIIFTPGSLPLAALIFALESAHVEKNDEALIVVDQLEEVFTLCDSEEERLAFFAELLRLPGRKLVVMTMRADFIGEVAPYEGLRQMVQRHQELVAPMSPEELRRAMEQQAAAVGLRFEADLGGQILDDVRGEPGAMPLLQHALQELWRRRRGRWLRVAEYQAIGGIQQAIAHSADAIYIASTSEDQERLRAIFVRLTRLDREGGEERRDTRQRALIGDLVPAGAEPGPTEALVARLADARLVVTGRGGGGGEETVEVAHEALIRGWPRLRTWLTEDRHTLLLRESLQQAAREWEASGRDEGQLFRGSRLDEGVALGTQPRFALNALEWAFLDAGTALRDREIQEREAMRQRELDHARALAEKEAERAREAGEAAARLRRQATFLRMITGAALIAMVAALAGGIAAFAQQAIAEEHRVLASSQAATAEIARREAETARTQAETARTQAETARTRADVLARSAARRALAADAHAALESDNLQRALALSLAAIERDEPDPEAFLSLARAADEGPRHVFTAFDQPVSTIAFSLQGDLVIAGDNSGLVVGWDPRSGEERRRFTAPAAITRLAFLPDRSGILVATAGGTLHLIDAVGGSAEAQTLHFNGGDGVPIVSMALAPDARTLYTGSREGWVTVWDIASRRALTRLSLTPGRQISEIVFLPDGRLFALSFGGTLHEIDPVARAVTQAQPLDFHAGIVEESFRCEGWSMAPLQDGLHLLIGCDDGTILNWNVALGLSEGVLREHNNTVLSIAVNPDDTLFASSSYDQSVRLWDYELTAELRRYVGHDGEVFGVTFSPDGSHLVTGGFDGTVRLWEIRGGRALLALRQPGSKTAGDTLARFTSDGAGVVAASVGGPLSRWRVADGERLISETLTAPLYALSDDGRLALTGPAEALAIVDLEERTTLSTIDTGGPRRIAAAFSPDAQLLLLSLDERPLRIYRVSDGSLDRELTLDHGQGWAQSVAFSPDGRRALAGTSNALRPFARLWDIASGRLLARLEGHRDEVTAVSFSPDGAWAITGSWDRSVRLWDMRSFHPGRVFTGHDRSLRAVAMNANGRLLLTGSEDHTARLWDVASGLELARLGGHAGNVISVAFDPDGRTALTATDRGEVLVWQTYTGTALARWARQNRDVPELSCRELRRYGLPCPVSP